MPTDLDDSALYRRLDPTGMRTRIGELGAEALRAWKNGMSLPLPPDYAAPDAVVVLGMGGSSIGGHLLSDLASLESPTPVFVQRQYHLPRYVTAKTLVVASSYSGETEETLAAFQEALERPCMRLVLTTGGCLGQMARSNGIPLLTIDYRSEPRAALAHSFFPLLAIACRLGIVGDKSADVQETSRVLEERAHALKESVPEARNEAKLLARLLEARMLIVYGAGFFEAVSRLWKTQVNENSKQWAFYEVLPELDHNAVIGYDFPPEVRQRLYVLFLTSPLLSKRLLTRYQITGELLDHAGVPNRTVEPRGESALAQMFSLIALGSWVSYYLAMLHDVDPSPVLAIDYLKRRLSELRD